MAQWLIWGNYIVASPLCLNFGNVTKIQCHMSYRKNRGLGVGRNILFSANIVAVMAREILSDEEQEGIHDFGNLISYFGWCYSILLHYKSGLEQLTMEIQVAW